MTKNKQFLKKEQVKDIINRRKNSQLVHEYEKVDAQHMNNQMKILDLQEKANEVEYYRQTQSELRNMYDK